MACKAEAGAGLDGAQRAVYRLNPTTYRTEPKPAYVLNFESILAHSPNPARCGPVRQGRQKAGQLSRPPSPSAVAVHPRNHHVFVLPARGNDLVELDVQGRLVAAQTLDTGLFPQPVDLAFAPNGDLFVPSETGSKKGQGRRYRFREQRAQP